MEPARKLPIHNTRLFASVCARSTSRALDDTNISRGDKGISSMNMSETLALIGKPGCPHLLSSPRGLVGPQLDSNKMDPRDI
jgi:hypothetical protein